MIQAYLNWSGGKDCALALYRAMQSGKFEVKALLSVVKKNGRKVAMHEVNANLLEEQAQAIGIPLTIIEFDPVCTQEYSAALQKQVEQFKAQNILTALFGDLYLENLRKAREINCRAAGVQAEFPLWKIPPKEMMSELIRLGFRAIVTCVDERALDKSFVGRVIDETFLNELPPDVDICGENGEYHSFVFDGPIFQQRVRFKTGEKYWMDFSEIGRVNRYWYLNLI